MLMKQESLSTLQNKSRYDDGQNEWNIPPFLLKGREITLPTNSIKRQAVEFMENQKNEREMIF